MSNKKKAKVCFISSLIILIGVPFIVTILKYNIIQNLHNQSLRVKISFGAAIVILALSIIFFKRIKSYTKKFANMSLMAKLLKGVIKLIPLISILIVLSNLIIYIQDLVYVVAWIVGCASISFLILDPLTDYYMDKADKDEQKQTVSEALKDANAESKV